MKKNKDNRIENLVQAGKLRGGRTTSIMRDRTKYTRKNKHKGRKEW